MPTRMPNHTPRCWSLSVRKRDLCGGGRKETCQTRSGTVSSWRVLNGNMPNNMPNQYPKTLKFERSETGFPWWSLTGIMPIIMPGHPPRCWTSNVRKQDLFGGGWQETCQNACQTTRPRCWSLSVRKQDLHDGVWQVSCRNACQTKPPRCWSLSVRKHDLHGGG